MKLALRHLDYAYYRGFLDGWQSGRDFSTHPTRYGKHAKPRVKLGGYSWFLRKVLKWPRSANKTKALREMGFRD